MIKVNLAGAKTRKAAVKTAAAQPGRTMSLMPVLLVAMVLASGGGGYWWYKTKTAESTDLDGQIRGLEAQKAALEAVIKQDQAFETRKKMVENRVRLLEMLQKNQVSPVLALDELSNAVQRTQYVWLATLEQKDAVFSMTGLGTSLNAIADFYSNLNATGYFKNVDLGTSQESGGNYTFTLKCEFIGQRPPEAPLPQPLAVGGN